ncbi:Nif11-like leader peptide family natural product precursor [Synechococcus sp. UW179A]|uniref:Nif11-like leader peptide family natural product precursor n=1 Tax=Synechococcus sp. UW179A TaxID=2575510 RepID=UPI000E0EBAE8|nr:Nif11-like leader peptide family natural product precursor [Synechococcus sp. UW179A]
MSLEQLKSFLDKAKSNTTLQNKLKAARSPEEVVIIGKENGHEFTLDKLSLLNDSDLEKVARGGFKWHEENVPLMGYPIDAL